MRPLTHVPLPMWRDLIAAILGSASDDQLAAPWVRAGEFAFWFSRSSWSLAVVAKWRQRLTGRNEVYVWVPDYYCNATLSPLREIGAKLVFYPITANKTPDLDACQRLFTQQPIDLFLQVYYFGQAAPAEPIALLCERHKAWLIEDAAHVLQPVAGIGEIGDCVLYSPHKLLPIPDGAVMVLRPNGPAQLPLTDVHMRVLFEVRSQVNSLRNKSKLFSMLWLIKRLGQALGVRGSSAATPFKVDIESDNTVSWHPEMSALAKRLLIPIHTRLKAVAAQREFNAKTWESVLSLVCAEGGLIPQHAASTPYLAGFSAGCVDRTEALFDRMQQAGLPVTTWPDLPPEVMNDRAAHPIAVSLRNNSFYLPVHQSLTEQQIIAFGHVLLNKENKNWQVKPVSKIEWEEYWTACSQTNLLQSWQYGAAKEDVEGWKAHRLLIRDGENRPVAIVQALTKGLPRMGYVVRINRGPLLLTSIPRRRHEVMTLLAIKALLNYSQLKKWHVIQIAPELSETSSNSAGLRMLGFHRIAKDAWGSGRLALESDEHDLLMGLKAKWRNCLRKGEKLGVVVRQLEPNSENMELLIRSYINLQVQRNFEGVSTELIKAMWEQSGLKWNLNLFVALGSSDSGVNEQLGMLVTIMAGDTTTYLIGSVTDEGRKMQANSVMLWQAIIHAKKSGCVWFDIGGLSSNTPKGIAEFKQGLGAELYKLAGEWRRTQFTILSRVDPING